MVCCSIQYTFAPVYFFQSLLEAIHEHVVRKLLAFVYHEPDCFVASGDDGQNGKSNKDRITCGWTQRKSEVSRFCSARDGDDLLVLFECNFYNFGKLFDHEPRSTNAIEKFALACIRRINLDAFWSCLRNTVSHNTNKMREGREISRSMGMRGTPMDPGPLPTSHDNAGYKVAIQIVVSSLGLGQYLETRNAVSNKKCIQVLVLINS